MKPPLTPVERDEDDDPLVEPPEVVLDGASAELLLPEAGSRFGEDDAGCSWEVHMEGEDEGLEDDSVMGEWPEVERGMS